ncbi:MAG: zinc ribbon domain-containing protein [Deltaproteobacteria bacterium]|nr:zinc ribbon domain-containing protein [Deltaproteobacteria bacterium]
MPVYEYVCESCGTRFDLQRKVAERNDKAGCPSCGKAGKRELSGFAVSGGGSGGGRAFAPLRSAPSSCASGGG